MKNLHYCLVGVAVLMMMGCVQTRYAWHDYDQNLYNHYKNPAEYDEFVNNLREVIEDGEADGKVPPGIYAEYGFALYEKGNFPEAVIYFKKEQDKWPESKVLMAKMINNAQKQPAPGSKVNASKENNIDKSTEVTK